MSIDLAGILRKKLPGLRQYRTNIIGAVSEREFEDIEELLVRSAKASEDWLNFARKLNTARRSTMRSEKPLHELKEPEWVQLCNFIAGMFVNVIPEFNCSTWSYSTGTQAT